MSLSRKIADAVDGLSDGAGSEAMVEDGLHRLSLQVSAAGPVGLAFEFLEFSTLSRNSWSVDELNAWGCRLAARVTYLMEPLTVLEADPLAGEVLLRSQAPTPKGQGRAFYEWHLTSRGTARMERVAIDGRTRRRGPATCQLTRESLERLADDLVGSVD